MENDHREQRFEGLMVTVATVSTDHHDHALLGCRFLRQASRRTPPPARHKLAPAQAPSKGETRLSGNLSTACGLVLHPRGGANLNMEYHRPICRVLRMLAFFRRPMLICMVACLSLDFSIRPWSSAGCPYHQNPAKRDLCLGLDSACWPMRFAKSPHPSCVAI